MEVIGVLKASEPTPHHILGVILRWAKQNRISSSSSSSHHHLQLGPQDDDLAMACDSIAGYHAS